MSSKTMSLVGALGLLASGANAATLHSSEAVSAPRAAVDSAASSKVKLVTPVATAKTGCFVPMVKGRMPKLSAIRKANASAACASNRLADGPSAPAPAAGPSFATTLANDVGMIGASGAVAYGVTEANKNDASSGGNR